MENKTIIKNGVEIDLNKVKRIMFRIVTIERNNLKTKERNEYQMVEQIQKIIEEEVKCL